MSKNTGYGLGAHDLQWEDLINLNSESVVAEANKSSFEGMFSMMSVAV